MVTKEDLEAIRKEKEYFIKRYNEEPPGEYKDQLYNIVLLAKAMEQMAIDELNRGSLSTKAER
ncbi:MAG: hypothetical protein JRD89_01215 [Deltaproteobacteria bacterium]|nr:hypothetical protein [Deltaproteobacteria bacterium]